MFAWVWYNEIGNREIYMDCASITIDKGTGDKPATPYASRPDLFVANLGNGCTTVEGKEVQYPDPGPSADVTTKDSVADDSGSYTGTCAAVKGIGGGSGKAPAGGSGSNPSSPAAASAPTPAPNTPTPAVNTPAPPAETTMSTITRSSTVTTTVTLITPTSVAPGVFHTATPTGGDPAPPSSTGSSGAGAMAAGSSCSTDGMWNCIGGTSFQQCASGQWSVVQPLAAGTQCTPGQSTAIDITAAAAGARRELGSKRVRRALRDFRV